MVIDHFGVIYLHHSAPLMEFIGRGTFPLFAYAVAMAALRLEEGSADERRKKFKTYLTRLLLFALISQPVYFFALGNGTANVIFTLAGGLVMAGLSQRLRLWQTYMLYVAALVSMLWIAPIEFGLAGVMLPSAIILAQRGCRGASVFLVLLLLFMNAGGILLGLPVQANPAVWNVIALNGLFSIGLAWLVLDTARHMNQGKRFLPKYALYIFYPAHLAVLKLLTFI